MYNTATSHPPTLLLLGEHGRGFSSHAAISSTFILLFDLTKASSEIQTSTDSASLERTWEPMCRMSRCRPMLYMPVLREAKFPSRFIPLSCRAS